VDDFRVTREHSLTSVWLAPTLPLQFAFRGYVQCADWSPTVLDLVEIAGAILLADRLVRRPAGQWGTRHLGLEVPVRDPIFWNSLGNTLSHTLATLTDDQFSFWFYRAAEKDPPRRKQVLARHTAAKVALFSGGLDSGAAAASFAHSSIDVIYVTHYTTGLRHIQGLLRDICVTCGQESIPPHAQFYMIPQKSIASKLAENSRLTRPFFFGSLALATAILAGAAEVCICENGPLAINLPLTPAMVPTKHAHSRFLSAMQHLAVAIFDKEIRFQNPFELRTKGEMARIFAPHPELALRTNSCWNRQFSGRGTGYGQGHCGHCIPCLVRYMSLQAAGIAIPEGHFDIDIMGLVRLQHETDQAQPLLAGYRALMMFCEKVSECQDWREFIQRFPMIVETESTIGAVAPQEWYNSVHQMMSRFTDEFFQAFERRD